MIRNKFESKDVICIGNFNNVVYSFYENKITKYNYDRELVEYKNLREWVNNQTL